MTTINARSFAYFAVCRLNNCRASGGYAMKFPLFVNFFLLLCVSQDTDDRESVLFLNEPAALPTFLVCIDAPINILNWWWADGIQSDAIVFALRGGNSLHGCLKAVKLCNGSPTFYYACMISFPYIQHWTADSLSYEFRFQCFSLPANCARKHTRLLRVVIQMLRLWAG